jgi:hypothetical protein
MEINGAEGAICLKFAQALAFLALQCPTLHHWEPFQANQHLFISSFFCSLFFILLSFCPRLDKQFSHLRVVHSGGYNQGGLAVLVLSIDLGPFGEKHFHDLPVTFY